ncbi:MAG: 30S ribosomal protein S3 [Candidatus Omnitrophica bacterium]|nr:30S ribosomal protein S3 [Candidatus Omnitrophota bacterium]
MGQKVHPISFRLGVTQNWSSRWYASKEDYADKLIQDARIRKILKTELSSASVSDVQIERASNRIRVVIFSGRPGLVIGRRGSQIELLKEKVQNVIGDDNKLIMDIKEVSKPVLDAQITADNVAFQLQRRVSFRRAMKKTIQNLKDSGGEGIKIRCAGRLGGAEIARAESYKWGKIPLQTIRADIDYGFAESRTAYGVIGVKVWIYKGEKFDTGASEEDKKEDKRKKRSR